MKKKTKIILSIALALILSASIIVSFISVENNRINAEIDEYEPLFPSVDFIQSWYACRLTESDWNDYFDLIASVGYDTVILQTVYDDNKDDENLIFYESRSGIAGNDCYNYTLGRMLEAADVHGINVYVGTYTPYDWWGTSYNDEYVSEVIKTHEVIFDDVFGKYGEHPSFAGWYFAPEIFTTVLGYEKQWIKILNGVIDGIEKYGNGLPMIFSPYRGKVSSPFLELTSTFKKICSSVDFRKGDILAPQDGFGSRSPNDRTNCLELYKFAKYCAEAIKNTDLTLWINCELYSSEGQFCYGERMLKQFKLANVFCDKTLSFSFAHYAFKPEDKSLLNTYLKIYEQSHN